MLRLACERAWGRDAEQVAAFIDANRGWLPDYALFMALKRHFGMKSWQDWPDEDARMRSAAALERYRRELDADVRLFTFGAVPSSSSSGTPCGHMSTRSA